MADTASDTVTGPSVLWPSSLDEALSLLAVPDADTKALAGGQSLLVLLRFGLVAPETLVSLKHIAGLNRIAEGPDGELSIGAMVTQHNLAHDAVIRDRYPALAEAAAAVASPAVRRLGTIGGNLCHADPTGDPPAALIALGAEVEIASVRGRRRIPVEELFSDYMETVLQPDELLIALHLPSQVPGSAYLKHHVRGIDTALVGVAVGLTLSGDGTTCHDARIGLAGAGVTPLRAVEAESMLREQPMNEATINNAAEAAAFECAPLDDTEASEWYRREMVKVFVRRASMIASDRARTRK